MTGVDGGLTGPRGSEQGGGGGISAALGAVVRLSRVLVSGHDVTPAVVGESFSDLGGELELVDAVLRDSGTAEGTRTLGLEVLDGARLALTRALVERLGSSGAHVTGDTGEQRARLELTDVVLRDPVQVGAQPTYGVHSSGSVDLLFRRVAVLRAAQAGVALFAWFAELGASLEAEDLVVAQTVPPPDEEAPEFGWGGYGLELGGQPRVTLRRVLVDESGEIGLVLNGIDEVGSRLEAELSDLVVTSTAAGHDLGLGWGVDVHSGARATFERVRLEGNHDSGLVVRGNEDLSVPTEVVARDLLVRGTRSRRLQPYAGRGVSVQGRASLTAQRVLVDGNREYGIVVLGMPGAPDTQLDLTGVTIRDTRPAACTQEPRESERSCFDERGNALGGGGGLAVSQGGTARLAGFSLTGCETVGLFLAPDASVRLEHGRIEGNGIGVNALVEDVTAALVVDDVFIFGNGIDVARRELPLPRPLVRP